MKVSREENSRVHREMEKFYKNFPRLKFQGNHQRFLDFAEQHGGSEMLTAENMELWLDDPALGVSRLAETADEAFEKFFRKYPAYNLEATRLALTEHIRPRLITSDSLRQGFAELKSQLPFDRDIAAEHSVLLAQQERAHAALLEQQERASLIEEIVRDYSPDKLGQDNYRRMLQAPYNTIEMLRSKGQEIKERRAARQMSKEQLREIVRGNPTPALVLPAEYTPARIRSLKAEEIRNLNKRYGSAVNERLAGRS